MRWAAKNCSNWHSHFTWIPTKVNGEWVWLERILRRGHNRLVTNSKKWNWEYVNSEFDLIKQQEKGMAEKLSESSMKVNTAQTTMPHNVIPPSNLNYCLEKI